jgi:LemA protein
LIEFNNASISVSGVKSRINDSAIAFTADNRLCFFHFCDYIHRFPKNLVASLAGLERKPYFEAEEGAQKAPKVEF